MTNRPTTFSILAMALLTVTTAALAKIVTHQPPLPALKTGDGDALQITWNRGDDPDEALGNPIGNGHIGAKIRGGVATATLYLDNKTFWSSWPQDQNNPRRREAMLATRIRRRYTSPESRHPPLQYMRGLSPLHHRRSREKESR